jgi:hypothetical protein
MVSSFSENRADDVDDLAFRPFFGDRTADRSGEMA